MRLTFTLCIFYEIGKSVCKIVTVLRLLGKGGEGDKKLEIFGLLNYGFSMYVWMKILFGIWGNVWMDGLAVC